MKQTKANKRAQFTGRGQRTFLGVRHDVLDSDEWAALSGSPAKLLIDLGRQYNGRNNGDLCPALLPRKRGPWKSRSTRTAALAHLLDDGWLLKTKQGGLGMGPDLYAITWWPIDACDGKHGVMPETRASDIWKKTPDRIPVISGPDIGHRTPWLGPESGPVEPISRVA
ncbi:MAG: hypothetical protein ABIS07_17340 [Dokdonella sp.]